MTEYLIAIVLITLIVIIWKYSAEKFSTRREKAKTIMEWFNNNPNPTYTDYKRSFYDSSNVVEYEDTLRVHQNGGLTIGGMEKII